MTKARLNAAVASIFFIATGMSAFALAQESR